MLGSIIGAGMASMAVTAYQSPAQGPSPQAIEATRIEKVRDNLDHEEGLHADAS